MLKFCSLYSGSSGNSFFVQSDEAKILIDAGVSCKKIVEALASINIPIEDIDGIFVTHEHTLIFLPIKKHGKQCQNR